MSRRKLIGWLGWLLVGCLFRSSMIAQCNFYKRWLITWRMCWVRVGWVIGVEGGVENGVDGVVSEWVRLGGVIYRSPEQHVLRVQDFGQVMS